MIARLLALGIAVTLAACGGSSGGPAADTQQPPITATDAPTDAPVAEATADPIAIPTKFAALSKRDWAKVVKAPDTYLGKGYKIWACVTQFDAATGTDTFRADASYKNLKDLWYEGNNAMFTGSAAQLADYVAGDIAAMSVVSLGSFSYDTQVGGNTTVPLFQVVKIKREKGSCG